MLMVVIRGVEDARRRLNRMGVDCVISKQCLELEMLKLCDGVTEGQMSRARRSSKEAKKVLKEVCGCECSMEDFERCFPKELLDRKRAGSAWLDTLIEYIEKC